METNEVNENENQEIALQHLDKLTSPELQLLVDYYISYSKIAVWIKLPIYLLFGMIAYYNLFIAGKRYTYSELDEIEIYIIGGLGFVAVMLLIIGGIAIKDSLKIRSKMKVMAEKNDMPYKPFLREFVIFAKQNFGGLGL